MKRVKFDINKLDTIKYAKKCFSPCKFFYAESDDFVAPSHSIKLHKAYAGDKSLTSFEGDHNSQRPQFFFDSSAIFFHNVLMCDSIMKVSGKNNIHNSKLDEQIPDKLPEFENTKFRQLDDILQERDEDGYQLDEEVQDMAKWNKSQEASQKYNEDDKDLSNAIQRSMTTITEEQERDQAIIDFFNKIGKFRELPDYIVEIYQAENPLKYKDDPIPKTNMKKYEELVNKAVEDYLEGNISPEEIQSIRAMLFLENIEEDTEAESNLAFSSQVLQ